MLENLELTYGALFSQRALLALVESRPVARRGLPDRPGERPARLGHAAPRSASCWPRRRLPELDLDAIFDPSAFVHHAREIVGRLDQIAPA